MFAFLHILVINLFRSLLSKMEQGVLREEEPPVRILRNEGVAVKIIKFGRTVTRREFHRQGIQRIQIQRAVRREEAHVSRWSFAIKCSLCQLGEYKTLHLDDVVALGLVHFLR